MTSVAALCALACGPALAGDEQRVAAEEAMHTLKAAGKYEDALEAAKLLIDFTTDQYGEKSAELINPYIELGDIQRGLKHPERGVEAYQHAADLIEMNEGIFSDSLIGVLRGMGLAYMEEQKAEDAAAALQRAKVITHRNYGIMNLQQIPILDELTDVYASTGDRLSADREQTFGLRVNVRRYGGDTPELVPALYHLADWYIRSGQLTGARSLYKLAASIIEKAYGKDDLRLVPALRGVAQTYAREGTFRGEGRDALVRITQVYGSGEDTDKADHGRSLIDLGDWYLLTNHIDEALVSYSEAWALLTEDTETADQAKGRLGKPTRLRYDERPLTQNEATGEPGAGPPYVKITFTVSERGEIEDAVVVDTNASSRLVRQVRLAVLQARYRPGFVDGKPAPMRATIVVRYNTGSMPAATPVPNEGDDNDSGDAASRSPAGDDPGTEQAAPAPAAESSSETAPATPAAEPATTTQ